MPFELKECTVHIPYNINFRVMPKVSYGRLLFIPRRPCLRQAVMTKAYGIVLFCRPISTASTVVSDLVWAKFLAQLCFPCFQIMESLRQNVVG